MGDINVVNGLAFIITKRDVGCLLRDVECVFSQTSHRSLFLPFKRSLCLLSTGVGALIYDRQYVFDGNDKRLHGIGWVVGIGDGDDCLQQSIIYNRRLYV